MSEPRASAHSRRRHPASHRNATRPQGPSFFLGCYDQALGAQLLTQMQDLAFANVGIDIVLGKQRRTDITNSNRCCEQVPDPRTHSVQAVASAMLDAESDNLVVDFGLDEALAARDHGGRR